jgi:LPS O-antigen subunit length determinant protein (WzzB/FepE family)
MSILQVQNKRSEVQELEAMLLRLQTNFAETQSDRNDQVNRLTNRLLALQSSIKPPNTRDPQFATPVFASDTKVSPLRGLILVISLLVGGFVGSIILIGRRIIKHVLVQEADRKKQMAG